MWATAIPRKSFLIILRFTDLFARKLRIIVGGENQPAADSQR